MCNIVRARGVFLWTIGYAAGLGMLLVFLSGSALAGRKEKSPAAGGQELFERVWQPVYGPQAGGDGLGPLFNERSCIACHFQGGIGGSGPNKNNVAVMTVTFPRIAQDLDALRATAVDLHAGFADGRTIVLHRFSTRPDAYARFEAGLFSLHSLDRGGPVDQAAVAEKVFFNPRHKPIESFKIDDVTFDISQRNTTPLFGLGLIDAIPRKVMESVAERQASEGLGVGGRFVGRFGWRGQIVDLSGFNRGACVTELGLTVSTQPQTADPSATDKESTTSTLDLTDRQCDDMTAFVASLPAPRRLKGGDPAEEAAIRAGERHFSSVGCATCHRPTLGPVKGIYSDLLVHSMGERLADPSPAPSAPFGNVVPNYYGGSGWILKSEAIYLQQWKTPPLWGLRDSGPYLHDGRADTVEQAITAHGGEARNSVRLYAALSKGAQAHLLKFLSTLAAPDPTSLPKLKEPHPSLTADNQPASPAGITAAR